MTVTISQIAKQTRVSPRAVSYALNGQPGVSEATRQRIQKTAREMGYRPNAAARSMRSAKTGHIGVLVRNDNSDRLTHLMTFETILGINQGLEDAGYVLSLVRIGDVQKGLSSGSRVFTEQVLDGIIVLCEMPDQLDRKVQRLIPNVIWLESQSWGDQYCLRRDEAEAGRLCAQHMLALGYRSLVYINHPGNASEADRSAYSAIARLQGVRKVADGAGVPVAEVPFVYDKPAGFDQMAELFSQITPDVAVIVGQAYHARWLNHAASAVGLNPPHDFGLCCCDDGYDVSMMWPGLSRVSFDRYGLGVAAADMMRQRLSQPDQDCPSRTVGVRWLPGNTAWGPLTARPALNPFASHSQP